VLGLTTGGTLARFSESGSYGEIRLVLYSVRRCILEYLGLEVMEPFVAYAAPRVDAATRADYLRGFEAHLLAAADDAPWRMRLRSLAEAAAQNHLPVEEQAWAAQR
jgi:NAD(P)H dehydrogenase (quinone)